ncbi:anthranilate phosphoribosyltransferase [Candidatus Woesearchaeota archaeon]|nr:anthranilate phosphoribosyltransferase [Candidatus Woesearchaeota archaeon]
MKKILAKLITKKDLTKKDSKYAMDLILQGHATQAQIGSLLTSLRIKGETKNEITGFVRIIRDKAKKFRTTKSNLVDMCGTGGDNSNTFNISTAVSFVAAGAGANVVKHGNRSASSKCGSADVLEKLGVKIDVSSQRSQKILEKIGICYLFAPSYHPSFKHVVPARKQLGFRTVFNFLGPMCNPSDVKNQVIGVYDPKQSRIIAEVLQDLGSEHVLVVNGSGLDEITTTGTTSVTELKHKKIREYEISPGDYKIKSADLKDIRGGTPEENKKIIQNILAGKKGPGRDIVLLNSGAAIYVSKTADSIREGIKFAEESIDSGKAMEKLNQLIKETNSK